MEMNYKYLACHSLYVDIGTDDRGIVAAAGHTSAILVKNNAMEGEVESLVNVQLEGNSLQGLARALHDLLSGNRGTREADLRRTGMSSEPRAKAIIAAQDLDDARRERLLRELDQLQVTVRRERRGLEESRVASHDGGRNLVDSEHKGEIPRDNADR